MDIVATARPVACLYPAMRHPALSSSVCPSRSSGITSSVSGVALLAVHLSASCIYKQVCVSTAVWKTRSWAPKVIPDQHTGACVSARTEGI